MSEWVTELFATPKPIIAMAHIPALPGTPRYDASRGVQYLVDSVACDVEYLVDGGVDAIMYCNEDDRPYVFEAGIEQIAAFTRVVTETLPDTIPFGVDFLWDPMAAMAIASATGASFIREVLTGTYESDMGLWSPNPGRVLRFRQQIGGEDVRVFFNVVPEFADSLGTRTVADRARSAAVSCLADVILVSGPMAGMKPDYRAVREARQAADGTPVFLNTGADIDNIEDYLREGDGVVVGSSLKVDGYTWNPVDPDRVHAFVARVNELRSSRG